MSAYTVTASGVTVQWHRIMLDECTDLYCPRPHATKAELSEGMDWDRSARYEAGKDAAKGE